MQPIHGKLSRHRLNRSRKVDVIGAYLDRGFFYSGGHLEGIEGLLMNPDGTPAFNSDKGLEWVGLLQSFDTFGAADFLTQGDLDRFKPRQVGYLIDSTTNRETIADAIGSQNLVIDSWPVYGWESGRIRFSEPGLFE